MALVQPAAPVLHIDTETVQQDLGVPPCAEQDQLDGVRGHGLVCVGLLEDHAAVIGQRDREHHRDGLRPDRLLPKDVHLAVGLDLADGGVDRGGAEVGDAAEEDAHDGVVVRVWGQGGRGDGGVGLRVQTSILFVT